MRRARFLPAVLLLLPSLLLAQAQGRVKGVVKDSKGRPITTASVVITCPEITNYRKEMKVDDKGSFATLIVDATKNYLFKVEAPGYQPIEQLNKPLIGAQTLNLEFVLLTFEELQAQAQGEVLESPGIKELRQASELLQAGKVAEGRAKLLEAVGIKPDLYLGWAELARLDAKAGNHAGALANAKKCLDHKANFPPCLALAANAAQELGDTKAHEAYMAAYKLANPADPALLYNEAVEHLNKGNDAAAKPLLEEALAENAEFGPALFQLGMIYLREGNNAKARELLEKFLKVAPDHADAPMAKEMLKYL
ncbi:MAG: carboxypeptidase regulatory-like domain-containing protein [Acidobacteriota bacterium]|jgi:tetratricopeptide (TPR) repeat protein